MQTLHFCIKKKNQVKHVQVSKSNAAVAFPQMWMHLHIKLCQSRIQPYTGYFKQYALYIMAGHENNHFPTAAYENIRNLTWFKEFLDARTFPGQETEGGCLAGSLCHYYAFLNCADSYSFKTSLPFGHSLSLFFNRTSVFLLCLFLYMSGVSSDRLTDTTVLCSYPKCLRIFRLLLNLHSMFHVSAYIV